MTIQLCKRESIGEIYQVQVVQESSVCGGGWKGREDASDMPALTATGPRQREYGERKQKIRYEEAK